MTEARDPDEPTRIGVVMLPRFAMMSFSAAIEALRAANRLSGRQLYAWRLFSLDGEPVAASNGIDIVPYAPIGDIHWPHMMFVCAGLSVAEHISPALMNWLRTLARRGVALGALSTATLVLARAGLLNGYRCTVHWENYESLIEEHPDIDITDAVYEIDRDRYTCSGGTAALDMMLAMITRDHGETLATAIGGQFIHDRIRTSGDPQRSLDERLLRRRSPKLAEAVRLMSEHVEEPLPPSEIADRLGLSLRQLERLFRKHKDCTPQQHYLEVRLKHARRLLLHTGLPIIEVSIATGFCSQSHFTKSYRMMFLCTPSQQRLLGELGDLAVARRPDRA